jgi:hypothetical protein
VRPDLSALTGSLAGVYRVTATIRLDHPHDVRWEDLQDPAKYPRREISAMGDTFEQAYAALRAQRPEGWVSLGTTTEIIY